jgi:hypothetical protein
MITIATLCIVMFAERQAQILLEKRLNVKVLFIKIKLILKSET